MDEKKASTSGVRVHDGQHVGMLIEIAQMRLIESEDGEFYIDLHDLLAEDWEIAH